VHALKIAEHVVTIMGKAFHDIAHALQIIQTAEGRRKITPCGKFIR
jgi:hypothetical protein